MTSDGRRLDFDISALAAAGGTLEQANDMTLVQCKLSMPGPVLHEECTTRADRNLVMSLLFPSVTRGTIALWQPPAHDHDDGRRLGFTCSGVSGEVWHGTRATLAGCQH